MVDSIRWQKIVDRIEETGTDVAFLLHEKQTLYAHNKERLFPAASIIKLFVACALYRYEADLNRTVSVAPAARVGGCGILQHIRSDLQLSLADLCRLMICLSDNTAANLLIGHLGFELINDYINELGCRNTRLNRLMMDTESIRYNRDNRTCAVDVLTVLQQIDEKYPAVRQAMVNQVYNHKLSLGLNESILFDHKTGELPGVEHDSGILTFNGRKIFVVLLMHSAAGNLLRWHHRIGRLLREEVKP